MNLNKPLRFVRGNDRFHSLSGIYYGDERLDLEQYADLRASLNGSLSIQVENPYKSGRYLDGFVIDLLTGAVLHKNLGHLAASSYTRLQPMALLWEGVKVGERVTIGSFAESRQRVQLMERVSLFGGSVVCRDGIIEPDVHVMEGSYLASNIRVGRGSTVGAMNYLRTGARVDSGVYTYGNVYCGQAVHLNENCTLLDGVKVANFSPIGKRAVVGEGATIGIVDLNRPSGYVGDSEEVPANALMINGVNYARAA